MLYLFCFVLFSSHNIIIKEQSKLDQCALDTSRNLEIDIYTYLDSLRFQEITLHDKELELTEQWNAANSDKETQSKIKLYLNTTKNEQKEIYFRKIDAYDLLDRYYQQNLSGYPLSKTQEQLWIDYLTGLKNKNYSNDKRLVQNNKFYPLKGNSHVYGKQLSEPCNIQFNSYNKITSTEYQTLLQYTNPKLESYFKEGDFLDAEARLLKSNKNYYLDLKMTFHSPRAAQIYGSVEGGSPIKLSFINGVYIYLKSFNTVSGMLEPRTGNTIYQFQFPLDKEKLKYLSKYDIDKFSFLWTSGVEDYPVYDIDVLKNMVTCLKQKN